MELTVAAAAIGALVVAAYFGGKERLRRALAGAAAAGVAFVFISRWVSGGSVPLGPYGTGLLFVFASACAGALARRSVAAFASAAGAGALVLWAALTRAPEGQVPCAGSFLLLPHAAAFMAGYALLLAAAAAAGASFAWKKKERKLADAVRAPSQLSLAFLAAGTVIAAFAARAAWGEYWAWDAKEAAALAPVALLAAARIVGAHTPAGRKLLLAAAATAALAYFAVGFFPASKVSLHP